MTRSRTFGALLVAGLAATLPTLAPAGAQTAVTCGQTITASTTLTADVGPCPNNGIVVGADNVVLDLGGHRVFGTPASNDGAGILIAGRTGVTVRNGAVDSFDGGVVIQGGGGNTVSEMAIRQNKGFGARYGDGIAIESSSDNRIVGNQVVDNGPFSGIGVYSLVDSDHPRTFSGPSLRNLIDRNQVLNNTVGRDGTQANTDNDGIRIENTFTCPTSTPECAGPDAANVISNNEVSGNGLDGISIFGRSPGNVIRSNQVTRNGFFRTTARRGDGIIVFNRSDRTIIENNTTAYNGDNGIRIRGPLGTIRGALNNQITGNTSFGNAVFPTIQSANFGTAAFDLQDQNPGCDANVWFGNRYRTANPACTTTGGQQI